MDVSRTPGRIEVEIGELVLHGFNRADRFEISEAMRTELMRQLRDDVPLRGQGSEAAHTRAGTIRLGASAPPRQIGTLAAGAVAELLGPLGGSRR